MAQAMNSQGQITMGLFDSFTFSAVKPEALLAAEYTLATLVFPKTRQVAGFAEELHGLKRQVVDACIRNQRADHQRPDCVLLRVTQFNDQVEEVHGFLPLHQVDLDGYVTPRCDGGGRLHDAVYESVGVTASFARTLAERDYLVNGLVVVVACDWNEGGAEALERACRVTKAASEEGNLESVKTVLITLNTQGRETDRGAISEALGMSTHLGTDDASAESISRLREFMAREVVATSQAIGTGGPSKVARL
jgi:hypothetical protein